MTDLSPSPRGYFGIGIYQAKHFSNVGVLWRSAYQLGAAYLFTVGKRYRVQPSDVYQSWKHLPMHNYPSSEAFAETLPFGCQLIGIEMDGTPLPEYNHPQRAVYILGAEDSGLPKHIIERCHDIVSIPAVRRVSYNVAMAGSIVMYDRLTKQIGKDRMGHG
mgnify:CR=1 FL=1